MNNVDVFNSLWVERYRPQTLKDLVLDSNTRLYFENAIQQKAIPHLLFCGPAGTGKTSLSKIIAKELDAVYRYINASDERTLDSVREKIVPFAQTKSIDGQLKIIILDELDGFLPDSQRALRNIMEEYSDNLRFIMTANYKNRIITPLKSRTISFEIMPSLKEVTERIVTIIAKENIQVNKDQEALLANLIKSNYPDIRKIIGLIQKHTKNGVLNIITSNDINVFAREVLKKIRSEKDITKIREYVIHNETDFNSDYLVLLRSLFEEIHQTKDIEDSVKSQLLVVIGEHMYKHQFVMDFEINAFCCIIQLHKTLLLDPLLYKKVMGKD